MARANEIKRGMAVAVLAIALSGLGVYKAGIRDVLRLKLGIHALMAIAVTGAFAIGQFQAQWQQFQQQLG